MHAVEFAAVGLQVAVGIQFAGLLPGKVQRRDDDAAEHRGSEVGEYGDGGYGDDHYDVVARHLVQHPQRGPGEGLLGHHEHHADQRGERNTLDQGREKQDKQQDHHPGHHARQSPTAAGAEVDHGLADHRAAAHAAEQAGDHIGRAQGHALAVRVATALGDFVGQVEGQQGFQNADQGHQQGIGGDDAQGVQRPGHLRQGQLRQAAGDMGHVAEGAGGQAEQVHRQAYRENRHQGGRHAAGQARQQVDDGHGQRHQAEHQVQRAAAEPGFTGFEVLQLGQGDDDRQAVDEAEHHRVRHHADQFAQAQQAENAHQQPTEQHGGEQVLHAVLNHQRDYHHRHRAGGAGDHARPAAEQRGQGADDKRAVEPHQRVEVGHQGEGDALGHQGEGTGEPSEDIAAQVFALHGISLGRQWGGGGMLRGCRHIDQSNCLTVLSLKQRRDLGAAEHLAD